MSLPDLQCLPLSNPEVKTLDWVYDSAYIQVANNWQNNLDGGQ